MKCEREFSFGVWSFISGEGLFIIALDFWRATNQLRRRNLQTQTLALMAMVSLITPNSNQSVYLVVFESPRAYIKEVQVGFFLSSSPSFSLLFVCCSLLLFLDWLIFQRSFLFWFTMNFKNAVLSSDSLQVPEVPPS